MISALSWIALSAIILALVGYFVSLFVVAAKHNIKYTEAHKKVHTFLTDSGSTTKQGWWNLLFIFVAVCIIAGGARSIVLSWRWAKKKSIELKQNETKVGKTVPVIDTAYTILIAPYSESQQVVVPYGKTFRAEPNPGKALGINIYLADGTKKRYRNLETGVDYDVPRTPGMKESWVNLGGTVRTVTIWTVTGK